MGETAEGDARQEHRERRRGGEEAGLLEGVQGREDQAEEGHQEEDAERPVVLPVPEPDQRGEQADDQEAADRGSGRVVPRQRTEIEQQRARGEERRPGGPVAQKGDDALGMDRAGAQAPQPEGDHHRGESGADLDGQRAPAAPQGLRMAPEPDRHDGGPDHQPDVDPHAGVDP